MLHTVWIPSLYRDLTAGADTVQVEGATLAEVIARVDAIYPGLASRLCDENGIRPGIAVAIDGVMSRRGLRQKLAKPSEIHFVPAMRGGSPP
jgi:molybdopterin converting factor small subunit